MRPLLVVTATPEEAAPLRRALTGAGPLGLRWGEGAAGRIGEVPVALAHLGIGKANTAAGLALAIDALAPTAVIQVGIGGAYLGSFLSVGMVMAAGSEFDLDAGLETATGWCDMRELGFPLVAVGGREYHNLFPTHAGLTGLLLPALQLPPGRFATSDTVTGSFEAGRALQERYDLAIESMEGAAAAQVCVRLEVPFAELRAVSNIVGERDKRAWNVSGAVRAVGDALLEAFRAGRDAWTSLAGAAGSGQ